MQVARPLDVVVNRAQQPPRPTRPSAPFTFCLSCDDEDGGTRSAPPGQGGSCFGAWFSFSSTRDPERLESASPIEAASIVSRDEAQARYADGGGRPMPLSQGQGPPAIVQQPGAAMPMIPEGVQPGFGGGGMQPGFGGAPGMMRGGPAMPFNGGFGGRGGFGAPNGMPNRGFDGQMGGYGGPMGGYRGPGGLDARAQAARRDRAVQLKNLELANRNAARAPAVGYPDVQQQRWARQRANEEAKHREDVAAEEKRAAKRRASEHASIEPPLQPPRTKSEERVERRDRDVPHVEKARHHEAGAKVAPHVVEPARSPPALVQPQPFNKAQAQPQWMRHDNGPVQQPVRFPHGLPTPEHTPPLHHDQRFPRPREFPFPRQRPPSPPVGHVAKPIPAYQPYDARLAARPPAPQQQEAPRIPPQTHYERREAETRHPTHVAHDAHLARPPSPPPLHALANKDAKATISRAGQDAKEPARQAREPLHKPQTPLPPRIGQDPVSEVCAQHQAQQQHLNARQELEQEKVKHREAELDRWRDMQRRQQAKQPTRNAAPDRDGRAERDRHDLMNERHEPKDEREVARERRAEVEEQEAAKKKQEVAAHQAFRPYNVIQQPWERQAVQAPARPNEQHVNGVQQQAPWEQPYGGGIVRQAGPPPFLPPSAGRQPYAAGYGR